MSESFDCCIRPGALPLSDGGVDKIHKLLDLVEEFVSTYDDVMEEFMAKDIPNELGLQRLRGIKHTGRLLSTDLYDIINSIYKNQLD